MLPENNNRRNPFRKKTGRQSPSSPKQMLSVLAGIRLLFAINYFFTEWSSLFEVARPVDGTLYVSFIDVGQGDSVFLSRNDETMLIDAGEREYGSVVSDYIRERRFSQIDVVVATHPHSDPLLFFYF